MSKNKGLTLRQLLPFIVVAVSFAFSFIFTVLFVPLFKTIVTLQAQLLFLALLIMSSTVASAVTLIFYIILRKELE